jgi:hypothetical protein
MRKPHLLARGCPRVLSLVILLLPMVSASSASAYISWSDLLDPVSLLNQLTQQRCPDGFELNVGSQVIYCIKRQIKLPNGVIKPHCDDVEHGKLGFSWTPRKEASSVKRVKAYPCPAGATRRQVKTRSYCEFTGLFVPDDAVQLRSYCTYIGRGYLGYSYRLPSTSPGQ